MPATKSILRYPGGKSQMAPFVESMLLLNHFRNTIYCEPFCGGAGIAFKLLFDKKVNSIILNDFDIAIYSIWYAAVYDSEKLIQYIKNTDINIEEWKKQKGIYDDLKMIDHYDFDLAFASFFLNRTNRSGILTGGPIGGYAQDSRYLLNCRFNKTNLIKKISMIHSKKESIHLYNLDAIHFINEIIPRFPRERLFIFFDPPYVSQGKNLYKNNLSMADHERLAENIQSLEHNYWITTYDNIDYIKDLYHDSCGYLYKINYAANTKREEYELLFCSPVTQIHSYGNVSLETF